MSDHRLGGQPWSSAIPYAPRLPAAARAGVRTRRICAVVLDLIIVSLLSGGIWLGLSIVTLGLSWFLLPPLYPIVSFFYNGLTISGRGRGTPGMRAMDLEVRMTSGAPVPFLNAAAHAVLFYISWTFAPILLISLFSPEKRCLHDMLAGLVVTRRPD